MSKVSNKTFSPCSSSPSQNSEYDNGASSSISPGMLQSLASLAEKKTNRDGNPQKRRGPKPDTKPALTRRQELNRQAQRTHRERKELYVKALEDEVLRLKEVFTHASQAKEQLANENQKLKDMLNQHGILLPHSPETEDVASSRSYGASVSGHSHATATQGAFTPTTAPSLTNANSSSSHQPMTGVQGFVGSQQTSDGGGSTLEQAGIDFVLTNTSLERPCMAHLPFLMERSAEAADEPCGHALMATCPPQPFKELHEGLPFKATQPGNDGEFAQRTWELTNSNLSVLLDLSKKLDLDGEVTPVMAWGLIMAHPKFLELQPAYFKRLAEELGQKVRCYGFGAVLEEFEVRDALEAVAAVQVESVNLGS
ncbi:hypothetical protein S40293_07704 [Stachybotrys chartarum IBT 40293]|nr:hypothetical protein S40293_07704 [Stachybotrys chartarum IBT 40293]